MRRSSALLASLFAATALLAAPDFASWYPTFQAAVAKDDAATVIKGAHFPLQWENGLTREIKTKDEFVAHFKVLFTAEIRQSIQRRKPERFPTGDYSITWKARGNEYSMYFKPDAAEGFILDGLSEGPP